MLQHNKGTVLTALDSPDKAPGQETSWTLVYTKEQRLLGQRWEQQTKTCPRSAGTEQLTEGTELKKGKDSPLCFLQLTFSSMIHNREMKSRSKVTKRQKVLLTSEMAFLFSGEKKYGEKPWLWDKEELMEAMAGRLRSRSCCRSVGLLILRDRLRGHRPRQRHLRGHTRGPSGLATPPLLSPSDGK